MISSGEGELPVNASEGQAGSVGALLALVSASTGSHYHRHPHGSVKAASLTADNDDDRGGLGFWKWQSTVTQIAAWGSAILLCSLLGAMAGAVSLWMIRP